jgi:hypothetical protein
VYLTVTVFPASTFLSVNVAVLTEAVTVSLPTNPLRVPIALVVAAVVLSYTLLFAVGEPMVNAFAVIEAATVLLDESKA